MAKEHDQEFLEYVVKQLVAKPDAVSVDRTIDERGVLLTLTVDPADIGYVIGKKGQTITSLRTLIRIIGAKSDARVTIKVNEPEGSERPPRRSDAEARPASNTSDDIDTSVVDNLEI